jgi:hypothetical protein
MSVVLENLRQYWWCVVDDNGLDIPLTDQSISPLGRGAPKMLGGC